MAKEDEGYLMDTYGNRVKSGSGEYVRTGSYDDEKVTQNRWKAAENKLAEDVQEKLRADAAAEKKTAEKKTAEKKTAENKAPEKKSTLSNDGDVDESDRRKDAAAKATKTNQGAAKPKSGIVTKEQLAKSSFTNLRDYMNDKAKLKRRDGNAPAKAPSKAQSAESTKSDFLASQDKEAENRKNYVPRATPAAKTSAPAAKPSAPAASAGRGTVRKSDSSGSAVGNIFKAIRERGDADLRSRGMKAGGSVKMAKGGSINGIAKRGLTKCKMR